MGRGLLARLRRARSPRPPDPGARDDPARLEERLRQAEHELGERRKELRALYRLSALIAERPDLDALFREAVALVPPSWQWPGITAARIRFDDRYWADPRFREGGARIESPLVMGGVRRGAMEVVLLDEPPGGAAPFLPEEQALLEVIAERLGGAAAAREREQRLARSEERFRLAVDQFPYTFVIYDADRRIRFINARGVEISGLEEAQIVGRRDEEIQPPEVVREFLPTLERAFGTREPQSCECHVELRTGSYDFLVRYVPVLDERGAILQVLGTTWDVTHRKRWETEQRALEARLVRSQKLESLGLLAGGVAHDFNNLLTVILGNASELTDRLTGDAEARDALRHVEQAAEQAADLTRQMLVFAGREPMHPERIDLNARVRELVELLSSAIPRTASLELRLEDDVPRIEGDPARLKQVLMNLVLNASDALVEGVGRVRIATGVRELSAEELATSRVEPGLDAGEHVVLEVEDDGCGMDEVTQQRIFDPFFSSKETGRGLGLAAVLGIVRSHDGALLVDSAPGRGSRFRVVLPAADATTADMPRASAPSVPLARSGRILVADDEPAVRHLVERTLRACGFEVETTPDGRAALERFREDPGSWDAVVLDLSMPGLDGEAAAREMRRMQPRLPVVVMSGYAPGGSGRGGPGRAFVAKPFRTQALREALAWAMRGSASEGDRADR